ncbi:MAG: glycosyltransferase [Pseudomonadota bacterium]
MKALFWVQHLLGIGHVRRAQALTRALLARDVQIVVVQGGQDVPGQDFGGARIIRLPAVRAADAEFSGLVDSQGNPAGDSLLEERKTRLLAAYDEIRPDIVITESFPFGRRALRGELLPLLEAASAQTPKTQAPRPLIIASIRDVLVAKSQRKKEQWMADTARRYYDGVIIHGDPKLISLDQTFPFVEQLGNLLFYSGYIASVDKRPNAVRTSRPGDIVISAGGGAVAGPLYSATLSAIEPVGIELAGIEMAGIDAARWRFLVGPDMPVEERKTAIDRAKAMTANVAIEPAVPDLAACLAGARLSISQAGYNTVMDILRSGIRALVVPFAAGGESEQTIRAKALAERGRLTCLDESDTTSPTRFADAIRTVWSAPEPDPVALAMNGADKAADHIIDLVREKRSG